MKPVLAPFPHHGENLRWTRAVWDRLGNPDVYLEPCGGSLAALLGRPTAPKTEVVCDTKGLVCLTPDTLILDINLRYRTIGGLSVNDELLGFDEFSKVGRSNSGRAPGPYRRWRRARVTGTRRIHRKCYRLAFSDGTEIIASEDHQWLSGAGPESGNRAWRWTTTRGLVPRRGHGARANGQVSHILKPAPSPQDLGGGDHVTGWLGDIAEGEGNLAATRGLQSAITQNPGPVQQLSELGFNHGTFKSKRGRLSPIYGRNHNGIALESRELVGTQEVVALETDTHTFIAEGLASHNCNFWRAMKNDPAGLAWHADYPNIHQDLTARQKWLMRWAEENGERLSRDPDYHDVKAAGWWAWGESGWLEPRWYPVDQEKSSRAPDEDSQGIGAQRMELEGEVGTGERLMPWFRALARRLSRVVVLNQDWKAAVTPTAQRRHRKGGGPLVGIFLDPPQSDLDGTSDRTAEETWEWARFTGERRRIAYVCREREVETPRGWEAVTMEFEEDVSKPRGKERRDIILFSPACIVPQPSLFGPDF